MSSVLVADDRPINRQYLTTLLGYAGHRVLEAAGGAEALALAQSEHPDLVVTDILMPGMDGVELVQRLRATPGFANTPVIFYTATYREREARALAESCGVAHVLVKPVEPAAILAAVHTALGLPVPSPMPAAPADSAETTVDRLARVLAESAAAGEADAGKLGALVRLGLALATEREPQRLAELASRGARELTGARLAAAGFLADDGHGWAHFAASALDGGPTVPVRPPSLDRDPLRQVVAGQRPLRLRDAALTPEALGLAPDHPPAGAFLGVPLRLGAQPIGLIYLLDKVGAREFDVQDELLVEALAAHLAAACENARLYDAIQRHAAALRLEASARAQAAAALRQSEARFRSLVENAAEMITVLDADGAVRYASPSGERLLGHAPADALGADGFAFVHPDDRPRARQAFAQVLEHPGAPVTAELRVRHADGTWRVVESTASTRLADPAVGGVVINARDITARKAAEAERERLRARERAAGERLARLHAVTAALAPALTEAEVVGVAVEQGVAAAGARAGSVSRLAVDGVTLEVVHALGYPEAVLEAFRRFPLGAPIPIAEAARTGEAVWLESPAAWDRHYSHLNEARGSTGNRAAAAIPLTVEGRTLGVLGLSFAEARAFGAEEREHLLTLARQCAQALERARLYEAERAARARAEAEIAERLQAEDLLRESEEHYRTLFNAIDEGFCVIEVLFDEDERPIDYRFLEVNPAFAKQTGLVDAPGKRMRELVPKHEAHWFEAYGKIALTGQPARFQNPAEQLHRWYDVYAFRVGRPEARRVAVLFDDITERKAAEAERESLLRQAAAERARLEAVLQKMPAGVIIAEAPSGRILLANEQMASVWRRGDTARFLEWPRFRRDGRPLGRAEIPLMRSITAGEVVTDEEADVERGDGTRAVVSVSSAPIRDDAGRVVAGVTVHLDLTERRRLDEELAKAAKLESIGVLAGGLAHDFNNLLTAILANASLARRATPPDAKPHQWLTEVEKASRRARDLTQRLLTFAKGGAPVRRPTALGDLAREYAGLALAGSNVRAEFDLPEGLWPVEADPGQLGQVIQNLVLNARQAQPQGGTLRVAAENVRLEAGQGQPLPAGRYVRLAVVDHGPGIPAEVLPRVLDPFFTTKPGGHGLGLAIAFSVVRQHGGHLTVESAVGAGTTVTTYLPASGSAGAASTTTLDTGGVDSMGDSGRILLMEDEASVRTVACEVLAALGYEAVGAGDGAEAVELYRKALEAGQAFDLVILDLTVPGGLGGLEALQRLLAVDPNVTAIVSSGYANDPILTEHARHGFRGAVVKPYTVEELARAARAALEGAKREG